VRGKGGVDGAADAKDDRGGNGDPATDSSTSLSAGELAALAILLAVAPSPGGTARLPGAAGAADKRGGAAGAAALAGMLAAPTATRLINADAPGAGATAAHAATGTTATAGNAATLAAAISPQTLSAGAGPKGSGAGRGAAAAASVSAPSALPQLLQQLAGAAALSGAAAPAPGAMTLAVPVPVSDPNWSQALAAQVQWLAGSQIQSATLKLSPEHLGPLEVRIDLQQSQVNVSFNATHADTRNALAEAMPRLRAMFAASGLALGQATVQQEPRSGAQSHARGGGASTGSAARSLSAKTVEPVAIGAIRALGLVDEYV